ncbi:hypothetical protein BDF21DRAFT_342261, partial [Thamnidium elegans]
DNGHTIEDSIKLMECAAICLKQDMNKYEKGSFETMLKRKIFCLQFIENKITLLSMKVLRNGKWACVTERSAAVPRKWEDRKYWLPVMELIMKLKIY